MQLPTALNTRLPGTVFLLGLMHTEIVNLYVAFEDSKPYPTHIKRMERNQAIIFYFDYRLELYLGYIKLVI